MSAVDRQRAREANLHARTYEDYQLKPDFVEEKDPGYLYCGYCAEMHAAAGFSALQRKERIDERYCNIWSHRTLPLNCYDKPEPFTDKALVALCKRKKWIVAGITGIAFASRL